MTDERVAVGLLVVDDEDEGRIVGHQDASERSRAAGAAAGRNRVNVVPSPSCDSTVTSPPCALRDVAHDREPEPGPAGLAASGAVDAVEALEDPLEIARRDPDAVVAHRDRGAVVAALGRRPRPAGRVSEYFTALSSRLKIALTTWRRSHSIRRSFGRLDASIEMPRGVGGASAPGRPRRRRARRRATARARNVPAPRAG